MKNGNVIPFRPTYIASEKALRNDLDAVRFVAAILRTTASDGVPVGSVYSECHILVSLLEAVQRELGITDNDLQEYRAVRL